MMFKTKIQMYLKEKARRRIVKKRVNEFKKKLAKIQKNKAKMRINKLIRFADS